MLNAWFRFREYMFKCLELFHVKSGLTLCAELFIASLFIVGVAIEVLSQVIPKDCTEIILLVFICGCEIL